MIVRHEAISADSKGIREEHFERGASEGDLKTPRRLRTVGDGLTLSPVIALPT
jgi:hypothetical protein